MHVELNRVDEDFHFKAVGSAGVAIDIDASAAGGGHSAGARPMETILMGLGGCSAFDVIEILRKQRLKIDEFKIIVDGERVKDIPSVFSKINIHFILKGNLEENKVKRAIDLSVKKYCSVAAMLCKSVEITSSYEIEKP